MKRILILFLFLLPALTGCKQGCKDALATNYDEDVIKDDGSCSYQASVSFWFNQSKSNHMIVYLGVTELTVYIDDINSGTINPAEWKPGPDCGGANFTVISNLTSQSQSFNYVVRDQDGTGQFSGNYDLAANDCKNIQLQ